MPKAEQKKMKRRRKYCPVCKKEIYVSLMREPEGEGDLYWVTCPECDSKYALTSQQFHRKKQPEISAIKKLKARVYSMRQTYSVGETIYHNGFNDVGVVLDKSSAPTTDCSGAIGVSFLKSGHKTLIEGYTAA